ncbi:MAG: ABC transporter ATP-binding protein [Tepidibacter sp.]|jgi:ABC-2 type transport system ATP-binding protein|uniref:ABC transporter ATP-binding protein n=1 Tax=Tepidibacter sp. TaxID=2529387 RepID=UPI0025EE8C05|nr:ABC transporter ATP-binding protein [Tepidibacter sp.]MCT4509297.1 ABC transporter ATP-binding protein [Tepidibacter sp.]
MIKINHVTKKFGHFTAVNSLNLEITTGEFCALLGPNGAGKTTLIKMLVGLLKPEEGIITINDMVLDRNNNKLKKKIGIVPQHTNLDKDLTVKENLLFSAKLFKIPKIEAEKKTNELIDFIDLKSVENKTTRKLSGGMKRKLMIAKALIHDPDIIFMDEPTIRIDLNARRRIWDVLKAMKKEGKTFIIICII